jgi:hypothetical protein
MGDQLKTGDFSAPVFNLDEYVEMSKIEARQRIASRERFLDERKRGLVYTSPMKKGTYELNKNYESLHTDVFQVQIIQYFTSFRTSFINFLSLFVDLSMCEHEKDPGKLRTSAKIAAKETWLDTKKAGMIYSHPSRKSSTPGDAYSNISQENIPVTTLNKSYFLSN